MCLCGRPSQPRFSFYSLLYLYPRSAVEAVVSPSEAAEESPYGPAAVWESERESVFDPAAASPLAAVSLSDATLASVS